MTNPNIPPEIADAPPAPAPVRISPEVRETILRHLRSVEGLIRNEQDWYGAKRAIAFVEALP